MKVKTLEKKKADMKKEIEGNAVKSSKLTKDSSSKLKEEMATNLQKRMNKLCFSKRNLMILHEQ